MNFKDTILPTTTIFAHVAGFKIVWPVQEGSILSKKRVIRSLYDDAEYLFDRYDTLFRLSSEIEWRVPMNV